jgi:hypothetical protein
MECNICKRICDSGHTYYMDTLDNITIPLNICNNCYAPLHKKMCEQKTIGDQKWFIANSKNWKMSIIKN